MESSSLIFVLIFIIISSIFNALILNTHVAASQLISSHEARALMAFKRGITQDPFGRLASWVINDVGNSSATIYYNPCNGGGDGRAWHGIVCDAQKRHVIGINLTSCNLSGTISPSLASLPALTHLDLSDNLLYGSLPSSLFVPHQSSTLQYISLSHNALSGNIPSSIGNLSSLIELQLSYNSFVNTLPASIKWCTKLEVLILEETGMTGLIPAELWQLPALKVLSITGKLNGVLPHHFGFCQSIIELDLENFDAARSTIPSSLGDCRQLEVLILDIPGLEGSIPPGIWHLPALQILVVSDAQQSGKLQGALPEAFGFGHTILELGLSGWNGTGSAIPLGLADCQQLQILVLNVIGLQGSIPPGIWQLPLLQTLILQDPLSSMEADFNNRQYQLHGSLPSQLAGCPTLTMLSIDGINLTGEIPASLGQCTSLQHLDLSHGSLQGSIPPEMFHNLSNLEIFFLEGNNLTGSIPAQLSACTRLAKVRLGANYYLSGRIPKEFGKLAQLQELSLYSIALQGPFPEELCNCTELVWLDLGFTRSMGISGRVPDCLAGLWQLQTLQWDFNMVDGEIPMALLSNLTQLQYLEFSWCTLRGSIPPELGNLSSLQHLSFRNNSLSGSIPRELGQLQNLDLLDFQLNNLHGSIPENLANATTMTKLFLGENNLQGTIPDSIGRLKSLQILYLPQNSLHGTIPWSLAGNCSVLQDLDLHGNLLEGMIPANFGQLADLSQNLLLSDNKLSGEVPPELGRLAHLQVLDLSRNQLVGSIPSSLGNCSSLQILRLFENRLSGTIEHFDLSKMPQLQRFTVQNNSLHGGLPRGFVNCQNLLLFNVQRNMLSGSLYSQAPGRKELNGLSKVRVLVMSYNNLSGEIPEWLWSLPMLQVLDLSNNHFTGKMPATVCNLSYFKQDHSHTNQTTLYEEVPQTIKFTFQILSYILNTRIFFDVSMNDLEGEIADSFGDLLGLTGLNLSHNRIQGSIPKSLGKLVNLDVLDLSHNNLSGAIPQEMGLLGGLSTLDLSYNDLQGAIPTTDNFDTRFGSGSFGHNRGLCGPPLTVNCTQGPAVEDVPSAKLARRSPAKKVVEFVGSFASLWGLLVGYLVGFSCVACFRHGAHRRWIALKIYAPMQR